MSVEDEPATAAGAVAADADGDGTITAEDAVQILRYAVRLIDRLPVA